MSFISLDGKRRRPLASPPDFLQGQKIVNFVATRPRMSQNITCKPERQAELSNAAVELSLSVREIKVEETLAAVVLKELLENRKQLRPNIGDDDGNILEPCLGFCGLGGRANDEGPSLRRLGPARPVAAMTLEVSSDKSSDGRR